MEVWSLALRTLVTQRSRASSRAAAVSLVSMQRSILRTVEMSMCSLEMELSHVVKLSHGCQKQDPGELQNIKDPLDDVIKGKRELDLKGHY